ncbi:MAG: hypothetical protein HFF17_07560, partial [Oscillospiraceae bacterium]|nr:hypothetical protein [Oscillospiraceae bacterium]
MTRLEALTFDLQNRSMFRMVNTHSDAVKAAELDMTIRELRRMLKRAERARRASLYQQAAVVLFFGSGLCASFGAWCQRQFEIVRKRRRNFVVFRRGGVTKLAAA